MLKYKSSNIAFNNATCKQHIINAWHNTWLKPNASCLSNRLSCHFTNLLQWDNIPEDASLVVSSGNEVSVEVMSFLSNTLDIRGGFSSSNVFEEDLEEVSLWGFDDGRSPKYEHVWKKLILDGSLPRAWCKSRKDCELIAACMTQQLTMAFAWTFGIF